MKPILAYFGVTQSTDITTSAVWPTFLALAGADGNRHVFIDGSSLAIVFDEEVRWYNFIEGQVACVRVCITL
jgi:hypothetical protein